MELGYETGPSKYFVILQFSLLIINTDVNPPDINPKVNELPIRKPIGRTTVLLTIKSKLYLFSRFCEPRQRKKNSNIAEVIFNVKSFNLKII